MKRFFVMFAFILGCSSQLDSTSDALLGAEAPSGPMSSVQEELTEAAFWELVSDNADLASLRNLIASNGYTTFVTAGTIADPEGPRLDFAAYVDPNGDVKTLLRHCLGSDCVAAVAKREGKDVVWSDADGNAIPVRQVHIPPLLREMPVSGDKTSLVAPLSQPVDPSAIDLSRRRLMVVNQFGEAFGIPGAELVQELAGSGQFTELMVVDYAVQSDLSDAIVTSYPHEVLVVLAQPVRQLFKQAVSSGQSDWYKTIGLELSAGLYGFSMTSSESLASLFRSAPLSGPGVVLLIGSESLGDGSDGMYKAASSMMRQLDLPGTVVAGFVGGDHPAVLLDVAKTFLFQLGMGRTVSEARDQANAWLEAYSSRARLALNDRADPDYRLLPPAHAFYEGAPPKSADFAPYFHFRLYCAPAPGKPEKAIEERQANPLFRDLTVEGPVFRGEMEMEVTPEKTLRASVLGVLGELREGAHFYFVYQGDAKEGYEGLTLYGNAKILKVTSNANTTTLDFTGSAEALPFSDAQGQACSLHDTDLEPMVAGQGVSKLILKR